MVKEKKLSTQWFKHIRDDKAKEDFVASLYNSGHIFEVLEKILDGKIKAQEPKPQDYESPSWAYLQADRNGYTRALKEVLELIRLGENE